MQGSQAPQAITLLKSNMWEPDIFEAAAIQRFKDSDLQQTTPDKRLQIKSETSLFYKRRPELVNPEKFYANNNTPKRDQSFLRPNKPGQYDNRPTNETTNNSQNMQSQQNRNGGGSQFQTKGNAGYKQKRNNSNKGWNKQKQNPKGPSGFSGAHKGNKKSQ